MTGRVAHDTGPRTRWMFLVRDASRSRVLAGEVDIHLWERESDASGRKDCVDLFVEMVVHIPVVLRLDPYSDHIFHGTVFQSVYGD